MRRTSGSTVFCCVQVSRWSSRAESTRRRSSSRFFTTPKDRSNPHPPGDCLDRLDETKRRYELDPVRIDAYNQCSASRRSSSAHTHCSVVIAPLGGPSGRDSPVGMNVGLRSMGPLAKSSSIPSHRPDVRNAPAASESDPPTAWREDWLERGLPFRLLANSVQSAPVRPHGVDFGRRLTLEVGIEDDSVPVGSPVRIAGIELQWRDPTQMRAVWSEHVDRRRLPGLSGVQEHHREMPPVRRPLRAVWLPSPSYQGEMPDHTLSGSVGPGNHEIEAGCIVVDDRTKRALEDDPATVRGPSRIIVAKAFTRATGAEANGMGTVGPHREDRAPVLEGGAEQDSLATRRVVREEASAR